jgi:P2 family phage contractile tail tube protein
MPVYPNTVKNFKVLNAAGTTEIGLATITLPKLTFEKSEYRGAGVSASFNLPVTGNVTDMTTTLDFHTTTSDSLAIFNGESAQIRCVSALWAWDTSAGASVETPEEVMMTIVSAMYDLGKREYASKGGIIVEATVLYLALYFANKKLWEVDPFSNICIINGVDLNANTRLILTGG